MIGVYIAHHKWLDNEYGPDNLYKVGYSCDIERRLSDSSYTTCFIGAWTYKYIKELDTKEQAENIEATALGKLNRIDGKELVNNKLDDIISVIEGLTCSTAAAPIENAITLHPYQLEAIFYINKRFEETNKAILQMACRTGKTLVAYKCAPLVGNILFFVPTIMLLRQTAVKLIGYGADLVVMVCSDHSPITNKITATSNPERIAKYVKDNRKQLFILATYQSFDAVIKNRYELTIFDEAHKMAPTISKLSTYAHLGNKLYITATPTAELLKQGDICYSYSLERAIKENYINNYEVIYLPGDDLISQIICALTSSRKLLVYCTSVAHIEDIYNKLLERGANCIKSHSGMKRGDLVRAIETFQCDGHPCALINCRLIQEGIELPALDAVFFTAPKYSEVDLIQCICRPLMMCEGKPPISKIYVPDKYI
jgi:superfamily II DNA or RNA helicase